VPLYFKHAKGARLTDVDGNEYVDFVCGFGPVILGHGHEEVCAAAARGARNVQQTGGQHLAEVELAEAIAGTVPSVETVRFSTTGSEAVHGALRLARAVTAKNLVVKFASHYHGWLDGVFHTIGAMPPGLPDGAGVATGSSADVVVVEWGDETALEELFRRAGKAIAAVIMEPLPCNQGVFYPPDGFLEAARRITAEYGALLVFDEVITGFRIGLGGAQGLFSVTPDITVLAKSMANGFPLSAFGAGHDLMGMVARNEAVHAGTYNGGGSSVAAGLATIEALCRDEGHYERMERLGSRLKAGLESSAKVHGLNLQTRGPGPVFYAWFTDGRMVDSLSDHLKADMALYTRFAELMLDEGVRIIPAGRWYLTTAHEDPEIDRALEAADSSLARLSG
jgi:glutamate-1-semialdehyde 2,1-aminomutase